jgi:hypothetical protein
MNIEEASEKYCPMNGSNCVTEKCMFWNTTVDGKKEVDRYKIPYDTYPMDAGNKGRQLKADGYIEESYEVYVKYEETHEGYCKFDINNSKKIN